MRRGLIRWNRDELPAAALDARVARLQSAMREQGLAAVLAYTSFAQPAPVQWLTNFVPYWSEAVLIVPAEGAPSLLVALTPRVHFWIREVSNVGELIAAPKPGVKAAELLRAELGADAKVGVIALDALPWTVAEPLAETFGARLVDATSAYTKARQPGDEFEQAMARKALSMAQAALKAIPADAGKTADVVAAVDRSARGAGAEEVFPRIAPDLSSSTTLLRMEDVQPLGERYAVDASLAYNGVWVREVRSVARGARPALWDQAEAWFNRVLQRVGDARTAADLVASAPGKLVNWTLEASTGVAPLSVVSGSNQSTATALPQGALAVFSVELALEDGPWVRSAPVVLGAGALA